MQENVPVISIVAPGSGYGKTQLIKGLVGSLLKMGIKTCVLKHAGHDPETDSGKDTWHFRQAGAISSAVLSEEGLVTLYAQGSSIERALTLLKTFHPDMILCEGFKDSELPKVLLLKDEEEFGILPSLHGLLAVVFDGKAPDWVKVPVIKNDVSKVTEFLLSSCRNIR